MFRNLDRLLDGFINNGIPGSDCIIVRRGEVIYRKARGYRDLERTKPMDGTEIYNIYSCTKLFTAVAVMQLVEEKKIALDDKLSKFIPEFYRMRVGSKDNWHYAKREITIHDLLTMTAGFNYHTSAEPILDILRASNNNASTMEIVKGLSRVYLDFDPGEHWQYGLCHDILAAVVEVVSQMSYGDYLKRNIFDVVGMNDTYIDSEYREKRKKTSQFMFDSENRGIVEIKDEIAPIEKDALPLKISSKYESGGAGGVSSVDDYIRFLEELRCGEKLLRRDSIKEMTHNQLSECALNDFWMKEGYGYGLGLRCPNNKPGFDDYGWGGVAGAYVGIDEELEISFCYMQHVINSIESVKHLIYSAIRKDLTGIGKKMNELPDEAHA